jgi:hypothetical protein
MINALLQFGQNTLQTLIVNNYNKMSHSSDVIMTAHDFVSLIFSAVELRGNLISGWRGSFGQ